MTYSIPVLKFNNLTQTQKALTVAFYVDMLDTTFFDCVLDWLEVTNPNCRRDGKGWLISPMALKTMINTLNSRKQLRYAEF